MGKKLVCELQAGDHIYCKRRGGLYDHHGIYVGDNMVIHLAGKAKKIQPYTCKECINKGVINGEIAKICIYCFLAGKKLKVYEYGVSYFKHKFKKNERYVLHTRRQATTRSPRLRRPFARTRRLWQLQPLIEQLRGLRRALQDGLCLK
ncbi:uncharacterized protein LOC120151286 [Hibiscus syriacus]|uniref:uncharacterized protein LOC120151286 n=1 Tax=Hibiscus syriacus TaxID=106335 RepID=UPI001924D7B4|nr:uncharacterized protein LOC120151286 [Hibiscus syriacus]